MSAMLRLTEIVGLDMRAADGSRLGRVTDLTIGTSRAQPTVRRLVVQGDHGMSTCAWGDVARLSHECIELGGDSSMGSPGAVGRAVFDDELCLVRDVLDTQIADVHGHRIVRVGDVLLTRRDDDTLMVVGVDVSFGAVLRRLGFRRASERLAEQVVAWTDLHLTSLRGHAVQLACRTAPLHRLPPEELAHLLAQLSTGHARAVLQQSPLERSAAALASSHDEVARRLLAAVPEAHARELLDALPADRARTLRGLLADTALPRRRYHRLRGWKRLRPPPHDHRHQELSGEHGTEEPQT